VRIPLPFLGEHNFPNPNKVKGQHGSFELALLKDLGEFSIFEATIKFHGSMVHSRKKTTIVASVKKNQTW
jgi:hypothetical protein